MSGKSDGWRMNQFCLVYLMSRREEWKNFLGCRAWNSIKHGFFGAVGYGIQPRPLTALWHHTGQFCLQQVALMWSCGEVVPLANPAQILLTLCVTVSFLLDEIPRNPCCETRWAPVPQEGKLLGYMAGEEVGVGSPLLAASNYWIRWEELSNPTVGRQAGGALTGTESLSRTEQSRTDNPPFIACWFSCEIQLKLKSKFPMVWRRPKDLQVSDPNPKKTQNPQARKNT